MTTSRSSEIEFRLFFSCRRSTILRGPESLRAAETSINPDDSTMAAQHTRVHEKQRPLHKKERTFHEKQRTIHRREGMIPVEHAFSSLFHMDRWLQRMEYSIGAMKDSLQRIDGALFPKQRSLFAIEASFLSSEGSFGTRADSLSPRDFCSPGKGRRLHHVIGRRGRVRQRQKVCCFQGEGFAHAQRGILRTTPVRGFPRTPGLGLGIEVGQIREGATREEGLANRPNGPLDATFLMASRDRHRAGLIGA